MFTMVMVTGAPFAERRYMMDEFLFSEKIEYTIDSDSIYRELFSYFIGGKCILIFLEKVQNFLSCFCLSHIESISRKILMQ